MKSRARLLYLLTLSSAGLAAVDYYGGENPDAGGTNRPHRATTATPLVQRPSVSLAQRLDLTALALAREQSSAAELFSAKAWFVAPPPSPPPPPPPPAAPVKPSAPPLPFAFMGRMAEAERLTVFLVKGDRVYLVSEGDVIDDIYKLQKIEPGQLTLLYMPLNAIQTLVVGEIK